MLLFSSSVLTVDEWLRTKLQLRKTRRSLFGRVDSLEASEFAHQINKDTWTAFANKWNYDPVSDKPLANNCSYEWCREDAVETTKPATPQNSSPVARPIRRQSLIHKTTMPYVHKTKITDYLNVRKSPSLPGKADSVPPHTEANSPETPQISSSWNSQEIQL